MNRDMTHTTIAALLSLALFGCAGDDEDGAQAKPGPVQPVLTQDKADDLGGVQQLGELAIGQSVTGEFDANFQFFGYTFGAGQTGATFDLEVTQKGSSRGLDTALFLYGERAPGDWTLLMQDDDDGWGRLSELEDVAFLGNFERYMAIVGTSDAQGRGRYRLELRCSSGDCSSQPTCPDELARGLRTCVRNQQGARQGVTATQALFACIAPARVEALYTNTCAAAPAPTYCAAGLPAFQSVTFPVCTEQVSVELGVAALPVRLTAEPALDPSLLTDLEVRPCSAFCAAQAQAFSFQEQAISPERVVAGALSLVEYELFQWRQSGPFDLAQVDINPALAARVEAALGADVTAYRASTSWAPAAGAEEFITLIVLVGPSAQRAIVIEEVSGD